MPTKRLAATPEELDAAAQVTPEDIAAAKEFARRYCTPLMNAMLNAKVED